MVRKWMAKIKTCFLDGEGINISYLKLICQICPEKYSIPKYLTPLTFLNMFDCSSYLKNLSNY